MCIISHLFLGWTGDDCKQRDLCLLENPCHGGGDCSMNGTDVNCMCPNSLTGMNLSISNAIEMMINFTRFSLVKLS